MNSLAITAANSITAVGHDGRMTSASVRAGISSFFEHDAYLDDSDNPITVARIKGIEGERRNTATRLRSIAAMCLKDMLDQYFQHGAHRVSSQIKLFLGAASEERPGPRYEDSCLMDLLGVIGKHAGQPEFQILSQGNASLPYAIAQAGKLIESNPGAVCIIGGIDSLIGDATLGWFEQQGRLKSGGYGRHQGVIAGEAAGFLIVENRARAEQADRAVLARIGGVGLATEPMPRASDAPSRNSGLTDACRAALESVKDKDIRDKDIRAVLGDLNGENSRAIEWTMADMRCFEERHEKRRTWNPANCYGDIGAASGAVLVNVATQGFIRGWLQAPVLIFCSDDHGPCGALVLEKSVGVSPPLQEGG